MSYRLKFVSFFLLLAILSLSWQPLVPQPNPVSAETGDNVTPPAPVSPEIGAIIGGVVGGLLVIGGAAYWYLRRRKGSAAETAG